MPGNSELLSRSMTQFGIPIERMDAEKLPCQTQPLLKFMYRWFPERHLSEKPAFHQCSLTMAETVLFHPWWKQLFMLSGVWSSDPFEKVGQIGCHFMQAEKVVFRLKRYLFSVHSHLWEFRFPTLIWRRREQFLLHLGYLLYNTQARKYIVQST